MQTPQVILTMNANEIEMGCSVPLGELRGLLEAENKGGLWRWINFKHSFQKMKREDGEF